jgi:hypothetical protein
VKRGLTPAPGGSRVSWSRVQPCFPRARCWPDPRQRLRAGGNTAPTVSAAIPAVSAGVGAGVVAAKSGARRWAIPVRSALPRPDGPCHTPETQSSCVSSSAGRHPRTPLSGIRFARSVVLGGRRGTSTATSSEREELSPPQAPFRFHLDVGKELEPSCKIYSAWMWMLCKCRCC